MERPRYQFDDRTTADDARQGYIIILNRLCEEDTEIALFGRYMGTPLALSLALNHNSKTVNRREISAVALNGGIYDWTILLLNSEFANSQARCKTQGPRAQTKVTLAMGRLRGHVRNQFARPIDCFDPFMSPGIIL